MLEILMAKENITSTFDLNSRFVFVMDLLWSLDDELFESDYGAKYTPGYSE